MTISGPRPDTRLRRVGDLDLSVDSSNLVFLRHGGERVACGHFGLAIIELFGKPLSLREAMEELRPRLRGAQDWIDASSTIVRLYDQGVLVDDGATAPTLRARPGGFDSGAIHVRMLDDDLRVRAYLEGIAANVREGDVVVDIGTGTGILALAAARAGARHVYAVEASAIGRVAQRMFEANDYADRITWIPGWSTQIELPERADVLVSEIIGDEPLDEHVLEVFADARRRLLKPYARSVPSRLRVLGQGVSVPRTWAARHVFTQEAADAWREAYRLDFAPLVSAAASGATSHFVRPDAARGWPTLTEPLILCDIDLTAGATGAVDTEVVVSATGDGELNGLLVYFELEVAEGVTVSTSPLQANERCSWRIVLWTLPTPLLVAPGRLVRVRYRYAVTRGAARVDVEPA
jgi:hypothetical protein